MVYFLLIALAGLYAGVDAFFYRAIPMVYRNDKVDCPSFSAFSKSSCVVKDNAVGYLSHKHKDTLVNPVVETISWQDSVCFTKEPRTNIFRGCANYALCTTLSPKDRLCYCDAGFVGNPYGSCSKICEKDIDCPSPYAVCGELEEGAKFRTCKCKYEGDGVFCLPPDLCKPHNTKDGDLKCIQYTAEASMRICEEGYFLDTNRNICVNAVELKKNQLLAFTVNNFTDGSTIIAGDCLSMTINNSEGKSVFIHNNSGDPVTISTKISTTPTLFIAFEMKGDNLVAYGYAESDKSNLVKLYTLTNTFNGCSFSFVEKRSAHAQALAPDISVSIKDISGEDN